MYVETLINYMSQYGEVIDANIKVDPASGRSRGFGFVVFKTHEDSEKALNVTRHVIDGKIIDAKRAVFMDKTKDGIPRNRKIFVGGIKPDLADDTIKNHFSQYGKIINTEFPIDSVLNRRRGFCFLEYDNEDAAEAAQKLNFQTVGGVTLEIKPAYTREQQQLLAAKGLWPPPGTPAARRAAASNTNSLNAALGAIYEAVSHYSTPVKGYPGHNVAANPALLNTVAAAFASQIATPQNRMTYPRANLTSHVNSQATVPTNNSMLNNMYMQPSTAVHPAQNMNSYMPAYASTASSQPVGSLYTAGDSYAQSYTQPVYDYSSYSNMYARPVGQVKDKYKPY